MTLYDKMPSSSEERIGDFALVALRVGELYDAAKKWQEEITMNTMISIRGGKRRSPGSPAKSPQPDRDQSSKVEMDHVQRLAKNPILAKVRSRHAYDQKSTSECQALIFSLPRLPCHEKGR